MLKPYKDRVEGTYELMKSFINIAEKDAEVIQELRKINSNLFKEGDVYPLSWQVDSSQFTTLSFKGCFAAGEIVDGMNVHSSNIVDNTVVAITAGIIGNTIPIVGANTFVDFTILNFSVDVYAVGMNIWNNFDPVTEYRIFDAGGVLLASFILNNTVGAENFFGFIAFEPISRVEIEEANDGSELFGWLEFGDCNNLSVEDNLADLINIYPNPATTQINVDVPSSIEILDVALYDILGKNTGAVLVNGIIDVSNISRGVYILNVKTDQGTLTQKVIKR